MRNYAFLFLLGATATCFFSCKLSSDDNKDIVVSIEPEFLLGMWENLGQTRDFNLTFQSIEDQPCKDNPISFTSSQNGRSISLNINEIIELHNCQVGEGPVDGMASFDFLPIGVYHLQLVLKNTINSTGTLTVTNEKYSLNIEEGLGFVAQQQTLMRVPTAAVWGYVAYKDSQYLTSSNSFLDELNTKTQNLKLGKGDYSYFLIGDNEKLSLAKAPDYNNFKTFYRTTTGSLAELETLLESYRTQYPDGQMEFKIFTWQGETL
ncbi:MAG: hypothetical protein K9J37_05345 [Saprospiraceae bacterium]|nr:hypothetical protein [Saprospiraceae bacterium]MCF8249314.1 hypothetical protein [Saprospiraceae bacterium]MCF8279735.1 hypothetical protein [Bacteroidales bacterium]MCF8311409.1 hypothetical protein [Saprospiraceae bacterium]MCF8439933.1 hypothetical protein [Saprospiraceae bacterium]